MNPTLKEGQLLMYYRLDSTYAKDDIVIVDGDDKSYFIKRIVGCPNDKIDIDDEGGIWLLKDREKEENFTTSPTHIISEDITYPIDLEEKEYFLLGDNRKSSKDSRSIGVINEDKIIGRVLFYIGQVN